MTARVRCRCFSLASLASSERQIRGQVPWRSMMPIKVCR